MKKIERPGPVNAGEFSPVNTPVNTGEVVTTAQDTAMKHRQTPDTTGPTGKLTETYMPSTTPVRK
jgi:hypothetical protein